MYAASGIRNSMAIATVIVHPAAMRATANPRPSLGASSCARNVRNGVRRSTRLAKGDMMNFDRCRHAEPGILREGFTPPFCMWLLAPKTPHLGGAWGLLNAVHETKHSARP